MPAATREQTAVYSSDITLTSLYGMIYNDSVHTHNNIYAYGEILKLFEDIYAYGEKAEAAIMRKQ